jgi:GNAT superfamily N-acetyltransferase
MIEVERETDYAVRLKFWEYDFAAGKRVRRVVGSLRLRWNPFLEYGEVIHFVVKPGGRRDGTGRALMFAAMNYFRRVGVHRVFCEVPWDVDLSVVPFLVAMGFEQLPVECDERQFYREIELAGDGGEDLTQSRRAAEVLEEGGAA